MPRPRRTEPAPLGRPLFVLNLKSYPGALGVRAERMGLILAAEAGREQVFAALAPASFDVGRLASRLPIPVLAQHIDPVEAGPRTGALLAEAAAAAGARGSLINHSERPLPSRAIPLALARLAENGLVPVLCARDVANAARLARFHPAYLAVEPPELIGGAVSVATARPEVISGTVKAVRRVSPTTRVLCGAGIRDRTDVRRALELGAEGILVASAVAASRNPPAAIRELCAGFRRNP